jgi:hypothetical protein
VKIASVFGHISRGIAALIAALAAGQAAADEPNDSTTGALKEEPLAEEDFTALGLFEGIRMLRPQIRLPQTFIVDQDFGDAEVDRFETGVRASVVAPLSRKFAIRLVGETATAFYEFHGDRSFVDTNRSGDPWDELISMQFRLEARYKVIDNWAVVGGAQFSSRWEAGSQFERGIQQGGLVGVAHLFRKRFSAMVALGIRSRMGRGGVKLAPVIQLGWRVTDDIEIETRGYGGQVSARLNPAVTLYLRGGLRSDSFRLENRGGDVNRGILRDRSLPIQVGGRWKITERWRLRAFTGAVFYRKLTVYDNDGKTFDSASSRSPAFTGYFALEYRF